MTRRARGFTLMEVLLAMTILALILSIVYGVVVSTMQAQERIEEGTHGTEAGPAVLEQIRRDLEGAFLPARDTDYFAGINRKAAGERDRIDFVSSGRVYAAEGFEEPRLRSHAEIGYQVKEVPQGQGELALYRRVDPGVDAEPLRGGVLTVLAEDVHSFGVDFWNGTEWVEEWASADAGHKLPDAVRVRVELRIPAAGTEEGGRTRVYETIVRMKP